ncbi:MAG TPA: hypothetical protein PK177_06245 [Burkholderiaceae bacterium]|nr:hypothetical protein [Burkholderiaceae bacterium]
MIDRIVRRHGLRALDRLVAPGLALSSPTGGHAVAHELAAVWVEAERMCGRRIDPLDAGLLDTLAGRQVDAGEQ